ncbi:hypothetical protein [Tropicibacter oceani]|uniref:Uncharacterized protein n=1 Tax=Tropicibacter oceani TaxID=3058420 RepID=A0ABY8QH42_9RHOB|nr:hypothetical protein [Tropicibacter oceani]WGW03850.1 hypothetical protein QF118_18335 [Tropicibacter oceani]
MEQEELARIGASAPRRMIGVGALLGLGGLLLYVGLATPMDSVLWQAVLVLFGLFALWASQMMWKATGIQLILTEEGLFEDTGTVLALMDEVAKVDRSPFAMKPSNGFLLILKEPRPRAWRPGLWWRIGRRVAVGGVTSGGHTKPMADIMTLRLAQREGKV